jgi:hypothetical protein
MKGKSITMKKNQAHPFDPLIAELRSATNQIPSKVLLKSDETLRKILAPLPTKPAKKKPRARSK